MENRNIGFGLIGTGAVSSHYVNSINELEGAKLVAVCSSNDERSTIAGRKYHVTAYSDYRDLIARPDIHIVCILTESGNHLEPAVLAARNGKHILCEKPLEINLERADKIIETCRKEDVKLGCVFQNRFKPDYQNLKQAVIKGTLGRLLSGSAYIKWYRPKKYYYDSPWHGTIRGDGGGALINQGIHTVDLLTDIMGEPAEVIGKTGTLVHKIEGEDIAMAIVRFKNGGFGTIEASTALYPGYPERLEIYCENGSVILEGGTIVRWSGDIDLYNKASRKAEKDSGSSDPMAISHEWHKKQIMDMIQSVKENREPAVNGEEGRKALSLVMAIYESARTGKPVVF
jgi:UDP-N-acetyl-2-amino-2-deoxyglucuronate dehydrogenase